MGITETIDRFSSNPSYYIEQVQKTGEPLFLTTGNGERVVIADAAKYRQTRRDYEHLRRLADLREALAEIAAGRVQDSKEFWAELEAENRTGQIEE
jgi:PHD/YefM family antitoxin component YafN of YafNO toxin-antitoxin module